MAKNEWNDLLEVGESFYEANEYLHAHRLTDGLPVMLPTPELVEQAIAYLEYEPDHVIATVPPWWAEATVMKVVANSVMAGCEPRHIPVVIAALEAVTDPGWALYGTQATTNPAAPFIIVNGPHRDYVGLNYATGALGPGTRANAAIGRALRLILMNIGGSRPGELDHSTLGFPGKFTMCIAEDESASPWEPFHVGRGWPEDSDIVTVTKADGIQGIHDESSKSGEGLMTTFVGSLSIQGTSNFLHGGVGEITLIIGPETAHLLAVDGYTKERIRQIIWEETAIPVRAFSKDVAQAILVNWGGEIDGVVRITNAIDDIHIIVAGGAGKHSAVAFSSKKVTQAREVRFPQGALLANQVDLTESLG